MFLLSLDEIDRVKKLHRITSTTALAELTQLTRKTWATAINTRKPTTAILDALADLGANPARVLTIDDIPTA